MERTSLVTVFFLLCCVAAHAALWLSLRNTQARWMNVPPVPAATHAPVAGLGDPQLAYRAGGLTMQNLGDHGGRATPLRDYDYDRLGRWLHVADALDPSSNFVPFLAAFYFGAVDDPAKLPPVLSYLEHAGQRPGAGNWRWLAHAVYLARFQMEDLDRAYDLALKLSRLDTQDRPAWTWQMPAFILQARGSKEEALSFMLEILKTNAETMHPNELNFTRDYICTRILTPAEAMRHPLCRL